MAGATYVYPSVVTDIAITEAAPYLGAIRREKNSSGYCVAYRLYQSHTTVINNAFAANEVVCFVNASCVVTNDVSASIDGANEPRAVGVAVAAVPESTSSTTYYGWFQTGGPATVGTNGDDDIAAGDFLVADPSSDGDCDSISAITSFTLATNTKSAIKSAMGVFKGNVDQAIEDACRVFAVATAADSDSANTVAAWLLLD